MDFKPRHVRKSRKDGLLYAIPRKTKPKGKKEFHFKISAREKRMIILMRRHGHSYTDIQWFGGRSPSVIHKILKNPKSYVVGKTRSGLKKFAFPELHIDNRKFPGKTRQIMVWIRRGILERLRRGIEAYVLGESDEPP
jgi:hypothetical protein